MEEIQYYKHDNETDAYAMARDYDTAQKIESRPDDKVTMHWAPVQSIEGFFYVQKPKHLECSVISKCYPNAVVVSHSDITWPEPEESGE